MRKYIDLIEATLYRGDSTEIDAYDTSKTYDNALFGRGIYLTDKKEVASDYTVNKGAIDQIVSNPRVEYHSQRDAIVGVITDILNKELDWPEQADRLKTEHSARWWNNDVPGFETRAMRFGEPGYEEARAQQQKDYQADLLARYSTALRKAKAIYKQRAVDYRVTKDTMGRWMVVKAGRTGKVSRFEIPDEYLARTLHGDEPLSDAEVKIVGAFIESVSPTKFQDFRDANGEFVKTDDGTHNFWKWVEVFKKSGSDYAWRDGKDRFMGGKGENPSLDQIWNGQHGGFNIFYKSGDAFIPFMQQAGYTGIQYHGGVRIGDNVRGGGGIRHTSYVIWDSDFVNKCRVDQEGVSDPPLDYDPAKLRSKSLYMKHKLPER